MTQRLLVLLLLLILVSLGFYYRDQFTLAQWQSFIADSGIWSPIIFILLYSLAAVLFLPGTLFTVIGGLLFGVYLGTLYNLIGATIGATLAFLIARFIAGDWVKTNTDQGRLHTLMRGVNQSGWRCVAIVRLIPIIPFNLLNYALGLTQIPLLSYILASVIFMLPGTFAYTYVGSLSADVLQGNTHQLITKISLVVSLLVLLAVLPWVYKQIKKS